MEPYKLKSFDDERGSLLPLEFSSIPFEVKRIFVVNNVPINVLRGNHSHYKTKQLIVCTKGKVNVILHDGKKEKIYNLNKFQNILVPELIWDSQIFLTEDTELLVLCSTPYDKNDYIFDFDFFLKIKNNEKN
jgi:dTDP-4-dehydrorhamnose 3,5-epimerase-like enzyme